MKSLKVVSAGGRWLVLAAVFGVCFAQGQESPPANEPAAPHGKVLFSRDQDSPEVEKKAKAPVAETAVEVSDAERTSLTFTSYDLDVHLTPAESMLAVHARFGVRNTGKAPLSRLVFQISSALSWESFAAQVGGQTAGRVVPLSFTQHAIDTDADHTGKATEAVVALPQPLEPGAMLVLTGFYSGEVVQSAERLERIGAPLDQSANADWDRISAERTALRGFGNVLWYPTAAAPVFLGDEAKLFQSVGLTKLRQAEATVHMRLTVEYVGDAPDAAFFCGRREQLMKVSENQNLPVAESPGVATAEFSERPLGFRALSLFITDRAGTVTDNSLISAVTDHYDALPSYGAAATKVQPLLAEWLGAGPLRLLNILDHEGQPFENDALLVVPMRAATPEVLAPSLVHSLSHAWFGSSHVWLDEGVAQFASLLWVEQAQGREAAVKQLQQEANTLALVEPGPSSGSPVVSSANPAGTSSSSSAGSSDSDAGQSLILASDEVYYRTKAAAVLWMLRSVVGDDALKRALQAYRSDKMDSDPKEFQRVLERSAKQDLAWFFDDWVYRDRGLPDLSIANVTPRALDKIGDKGKGFLVSVEVKNDGDAAAEVPVTVRSGTLTSTQRLRIAGRSSASTRVVFEGTPDEVIVNDGSVPEVTASIHTKQIVAH
ncbi:M1 family aminopeptidase [Tunturiibacter empetritectus]|uniref:M1 family aminopeptidase n=1 Tax=Tunturiibacter empetritectus TaxID=3069691 RepID=UPI003D9BCC96